jgi:hypothetical protein
MNHTVFSIHWVNPDALIALFIPFLMYPRAITWWTTISCDQYVVWLAQSRHFCVRQPSWSTNGWNPILRIVKLAFELLVFHCQTSRQCYLKSDQVTLVDELADRGPVTICWPDYLGLMEWRIMAILLQNQGKKNVVAGFEHSWLDTCPFPTNPHWSRVTMKIKSLIWRFPEIGVP